MSRRTTRTELVRDAALDNDLSLDEALVLLRRLNHVYGRDPATKKVLSRLVDIVIGHQQRDRLIHQDAESAWRDRERDELIDAQQY